MSTLEEHWDTVSALVVLANGFLVSGSIDARIKLWDVTSGACVATFPRDRGAALAVLSSSLLISFLASGSEDKTIELWKVDFSPIVIPEEAQALDQTHALPPPLYAGSENSFFPAPALPTSTSAVSHVVASEKKV